MISNSSSQQSSMKNKHIRGVVEIAIIIMIAIVGSIILRLFFLALFYIPSPSMDPYLKVNDKIFVNKLAYTFHDVERGDVIVFDAPDSVKNQHVEGSSTPKIEDLIKRVVGLPGETVEGRCAIETANQCVVDIYINGKKLNEPYLSKNISYAPFDPIQIPANSILAMGDNRDDSEDGRFFGPTPKKSIIGRAFFRLWPSSRFGFL